MKRETPGSKSAQPKSPNRLETAFQQNKETSIRFFQTMEDTLRSLSHLSVLVIGGDHLKMIEDALQGQDGIEVFTADSGENALQLFRANPADLVVVDADLKDESISSLLSKIRETASPRHVASIIVTGEENSERVASQVGADSGLRLPMQASDFIKAAQSMLSLDSELELSPLFD